MIFLSEFKQLKSPEAGRSSFKHFTCGFNFVDLLKKTKMERCQFGKAKRQPAHPRVSSDHGGCFSLS